MGYVRLRARPARRLKRRRAGTARVDGLPRRALDLLEKPLDPAVISERETRDGRLVSYIEGWATIAQANRIFGFDAWGVEVVGDVAYRAFDLSDPDTGERLAVGMYSASVRVVARGCLPRVDVGCSFAAGDTPDAHETAFKGAVTDAMKRALRYFGVQFGNGLYDRRGVPEVAASPPAASPPPRRPEEMRRRVIDLSARLGDDDAKARAWAEKRYGQPLDELSAEQLADAVRFLADQLNRRNGATPKRGGAESGSQAA